MKKIFILIIGIIAACVICYGVHFAIEKQRAEQKESERFFINAIERHDLIKMKELYSKHHFNFLTGSPEMESAFLKVLRELDAPDGWALMDFMLQNGLDINKKDEDGKSPFMTVLERASVPSYIIKNLLEKSADITIKNKNYTMLDYAISGGKIATIELILEKGADPNANNPLEYCFKYDIKELLLTHGAKPQAIESPIVDIPYNTADRRLIKIFIKYGVDLNVRIDGETPLIRAVDAQNLDTVKILLEYGVDPNISETFEGNSPLHIAVKNNDYEASEILLKHGANVNLLNETNATPLHYAAFAENYRLVKFLLESGATPDVIDNDGFSPLFYAVMHEDYQMAALLLLHDANPDISCNKKSTPRELAKERFNNPAYADTKKLYLDILELMKRKTSRTE